MSEGWYLSDLLEDASDYEEGEAERRFIKMTDRYLDAKRAEVGATIRCPGCGRLFVKRTYNKIFCSNQKTTRRGVNSCKDYYWNTVNPRGIGARR